MADKLTFRGVLPKNPTYGYKNFMKDRIWETYSILTSICNSLNAEAGRFIRTDPYLQNLLEKTQCVITILLDETGRLKEWEEWKDTEEDREAKIQEIFGDIPKAKLYPDYDMCCKCRYYQGVHNVAGHATCEKLNVSTLWKYNCPLFEVEE